MEFLVAKCPNCGGELRLPDDKKQVKCMYCGFDIIVRDAVNAAGANVENWLKLASDGEAAGNHIEAYEYFTQVLEFEPENYIAQLGKGITAGYLSTPYNFRFSELMGGVNKAIENAPEDKKEETKLQAAKKIRQVCSAFKVDRNSDASKIEVNGVIACLELAHRFNPQNEDIIQDLYFQCKLQALYYKTMVVGTQSTIFDNNIAESNKKAGEYLSKLQIINPEKADSLIKSETTANKANSLQATGGSGCLVTILCFILTSVFLLAVLI